MKSKTILIFQKISDARLFIYGIAIIWIVIFHAHISAMPLYINFPVCKIGYGGVDLFIILSGFGIYCSLNKNSNEIEFYKKRVRRLLPVIPIMILYVVFSHITSFHQIVGYILNINTFVSDKFVNGSYRHFWYISAILIFYLIAPILYRIINDNKKNVIYLILLSLLFIIPFWGNKNLIIVARLPLFIFGMFCGYLYKHEINVSKNIILLTHVLGGISFVSLILCYLYVGELKYYYGLIRYPFYFIAPSLCISLSYLYSFLKQNNILKQILKLPEKIGSMSLEIYLTDALFTCGCIPFIAMVSWGGGKIVLNIICGTLYYLIWNTIKKGVKIVTKSR